MLPITGDIRWITDSKQQGIGSGQGAAGIIATCMPLARSLASFLVVA
jgi:hypothetical protein